MSVCPVCHLENHPDSLFCVFCGAKLTPQAAAPAEKKCPICGNLNKADFKYCRTCGAAFSGKATAEAQQLVASLPEEEAQALPLPEEVPGIPEKPMEAAEVQVIPDPTPIKEEIPNSPAAPVAAGAPEPKTIVCPACGNVNPYSASFCYRCGLDLDSIREALSKAQSRRVGGVSAVQPVVPAPPAPPVQTQAPVAARQEPPPQTQLPAAPQTPPTPSHTSTAQPPAVAPARSGTGISCLVVALIVLLAVMVFTNPTRKDHESAIYSELGQAAGETLGGSEYSDPLGALGGLFGQGLGTLTNLAGISPFDYQSYLIFSLTYFNGEPITLGAFGNVSILKPVDQWSAELQSAIEQMIP